MTGIFGFKFQSKTEAEDARVLDELRKKRIDQLTLLSRRQAKRLDETAKKLDETANRLNAAIRMIEILKDKLRDKENTAEFWRAKLAMAGGNADERQTSTIQRLNPR